MQSLIRILLVAFSASNICRAHIAEGCSPCLALPFLARPELSSMLQVRAQPRARVFSVCTGISMYLCICACCNIENIHERLVNFMHPHSYTGDVRMVGARGCGEQGISPLVTLTELITVCVPAFQCFQNSLHARIPFVLITYLKLVGKFAKHVVRSAPLLQSIQ